MAEADLVLRDGRIAEVGPVGARGARDVDVRGLIVAPGFVDVHTHYDAQITLVSSFRWGWRS